MVNLTCHIQCNRISICDYRIWVNHSFTEVDFAIKINGQRADRVSKSVHSWTVRSHHRSCIVTPTQFWAITTPPHNIHTAVDTSHCSHIALQSWWRSTQLLTTRKSYTYIRSGNCIIKKDTSHVHVMNCNLNNMIYTVIFKGCRFWKLYDDLTIHEIFYSQIIIIHSIGRIKWNSKIKLPKYFPSWHPRNIRPSKITMYIVQVKFVWLTTVCVNEFTLC